MTATSAMIFAAGFGTRMGDLTKDMPKPMIPLNGRPMVDHAISHVRGAGIDQIVANIHYLPDVIRPQLEAQGVQVVEENPILETGGGLKAARHLLTDDPVLTINPDVAWTGPNPVECALRAWKPDMRALLLLVPMDRAGTDRKNGDFSLEQGEISRNGDFIYTGVQVLRTDWLDEIPEAVFSLNRYWDHLARRGRLNGVVYPGHWYDIGTPQGLSRAERALSNAV